MEIEAPHQTAPEARSREGGRERRRKGSGVERIAAAAAILLLALSLIGKCSAAARREDSKCHLYMATYYSEEIAHYATLIAAVNSRFAEAQSIPFQAVSNRSDALGDLRWVKVPLLLEGLQSWASDCEFVAFVDADLFILDTNLNLMELVQRHAANADVIMAEDALDFANTGFIIVRNSPWSAQFLTEWYGARDLPGVFCDQHALNVLSLQLRARGDLHHLRILPPRTINSLWPSLETFQEGDPVLHLMGEFNEVRHAIAEYVVSRLQSSLDDPLRLSRAELQAVKRSALLSMIAESRGRADWTKQVDVLDHFCRWNESECRESALQAMDNLQLELGHRKLLLASDDSQTSLQDFLDISSSLNDVALLAMRSASLEACVQIARSIQDRLATQQELVKDLPSNRAFEHSVRARLFRVLAGCFDRSALSQPALEARQVAATELQFAVQFYSPQPGKWFYQSMLDYVRVAQELGEGFAAAGDRSVAKEWCRVALENSAALGQVQDLEARLAVEALRSALQACGEVLGEEEMVTWQTHTRDYFAPRS